MEGEIIKNNGSKRYIRLENYMLLYLSSKNEENPTDAIDLRSIVSVYPDNDKASFFIQAEKRKYKFKLSNAMERKAWINILKVFSMEKRSIQIPYVMFYGLKKSLEHILENGGTFAEGIFHKPPPDEEKVIQLFKEFLSTKEKKIPPYIDIYTIGFLVIKLLNELPETILTNNLFEKFCDATDSTIIKKLIDSLPFENKTILYLLAKVFHKVCQNSKKTKMTPEMLGVLFAQTLLRRDIKPNEYNFFQGRLEKFLKLLIQIGQIGEISSNGNISEESRSKIRDLELERHRLKSVLHEKEEQLQISQKEIEKYVNTIKKNMLHWNSATQSTYQMYNEILLRLAKAEKERDVFAKKLQKKSQTQSIVKKKKIRKDNQNSNRSCFGLF